MRHSITKVCGTIIGYNCVYRDYKTLGIDRFLSGHSLGFTIEMMSEEKEKLENYVTKSCDWMNHYFEEAFANTLIVSTHDPFVNVICILESEGLVDIRLMEKVSVPDFAQMIRDDFSEVMKDQTNGEIQIRLVKVTEHGSMTIGVA